MTAAPATAPDRALCWLAGVALAQALCDAAIARLSPVLAWGTSPHQRPLLLVLSLLAASFGLYVMSLRLALRCRWRPHLLGLILAAAVAFRGILLTTEPIQEVDLYRYLWDGAVCAAGISPYCVPPADVRTPDRLPPGTLSPQRTEVLHRLRTLGNSSPGLAAALARIHYAELTTPYPPVNQAVFALAAHLAPPKADLAARVIRLKGVLLLFDLATVGLVLWLLSTTGRHPGWSIAYAWCPLVLKEFANSGHLDAIAVCLTTACLGCAVQLLAAPRQPWRRWALAAAILLGLAVGAKLYPIVLLPLLTLAGWRRAGVRGGALVAAGGILASALCLAPMCFPVLDCDPASVPHAADPPLPDDALADAAARPPDGLAEPRRARPLGRQASDGGKLGRALCDPLH